MKRLFPAPPRAAVAVRRGYADLARRRAGLEQLLDAGDMAGARDAAADFATAAHNLRRLLADHLPETAPPPAALDAPCDRDADDHALRLNLPETLHAVMSWLGARRRLVLAGLGERRRLALRFVATALCLGLVLALTVGGREAWRWRQLELSREARSNFALDLMGGDAALPPDFKVAGLLGVEHGEDGTAWRWGIGPRTIVAFTLPLPRTVRLAFRVNNPVPDQVLTVTANGAATTFPLPRTHRWLEPGESFELTFPGLAGLNTITIDYKAYNQYTMAFAPSDPAGYAAAFTALSIATERP